MSVCIFSIEGGKAESACFIVDSATITEGDASIYPIEDCHTLANSGPVCSSDQTANVRKVGEKNVVIDG